MTLHLHSSKWSNQAPLQKRLSIFGNVFWGISYFVGAAAGDPNHQELKQRSNPIPIRARYPFAAFVSKPRPRVRVIRPCCADTLIGGKSSQKQLKISRTKLHWTFIIMIQSFLMMLTLGPSSVDSNFFSSPSSWLPKSRILKLDLYDILTKLFFRAFSPGLARTE